MSHGGGVGESTELGERQRHERDPQDAADLGQGVVQAGGLSDLVRMDAPRHRRRQRGEAGGVADPDDDQRRHQPHVGHTGLGDRGQPPVPRPGEGGHGAGQVPREVPAFSLPDDTSLPTLAG